MLDKEQIKKMQADQKKVAESAQAELSTALEDAGVSNKQDLRRKIIEGNITLKALDRASKFAQLAVTELGKLQED